jgi:hypothetical protein
VHKTSLEEHQVNNSKDLTYIDAGAIFSLFYFPPFFPISHRFFLIFRHFIQFRVIFPISSYFFQFGVIFSNFPPFFQFPAIFMRTCCLADYLPPEATEVAKEDAAEEEEAGVGVRHRRPEGPRNRRRLPGLLAEVFPHCVLPGAASSKASRQS